MSYFKSKIYRNFIFSFILYLFCDLGFQCFHIHNIHIQKNQNDKQCISLKSIVKTNQSKNLEMTRKESLYYCKGLHEIASDYDAMLIDQWGVLHNGKKPYDGVINTLQKLSTQKKKLILLSNSSRRKDESIKGLRKVGIDPDLFFDIITSGEMTWRLFHSRDILRALNLKGDKDIFKVFVIGNGDDDREYIESANYIFADSLNDADFILARGTFSIGNTKFATSKEFFFHIETVLAEASLKKLPMVVSNPDMLRPGTNDAMPGKVADMYMQLSNDNNVKFYGKPYPDVFDEAFNLLSISGLSSKDRICMIGDSLEHDIKGALNMNIDSLWITNGVHSSDLNTLESSDVIPNTDDMFALVKKYNSYPTKYTPRFSW